MTAQNFNHVDGFPADQPPEASYSGMSDLFYDEPQVRRNVPLTSSRVRVLFSGNFLCFDVILGLI
jgi:hypothetical protein